MFRCVLFGLASSFFACLSLMLMYTWHEEGEEEEE